MSRYAYRKHVGKPGLGNSVIVIEDDKTLLGNLCYLFEAERIACIPAADGLTGMALVEEHQPKVVILDMYVPHYSGFEIVDEIRKNPLLTGTFVIAITGMAEDDEDLKAMKGRADMILAKPIDERRLLDFVHAALRDDTAPSGFGRYRHS